ncbi:aldehyde dehydrogenase family protein [Streptomyces sp. NPDC048290]|uniref:aldehyde dehydrogenase family protein n=1 Tax=Streptomyces sp. NPDC048290 TaxID=3155811 RepID=UPI0034489F1D
MTASSQPSSVPTIPASAHEVLNLVDGTWQPARSGRTLARENPARADRIIAVCPASDASDAGAAVAAARAAAADWAATPVEDRIAVIGRALELLESRSEALAVADVLESGKTLADCEGEIARALAATAYQLKIAPDLLSHVRALESDLDVEMTRAPVGVAVLVTPWNYPFSAVLRKSVPALVAGNAVVVKPSELTPVTAEMVGRALMESGLPAGVYNLVFGTGQEAGQPLLDHPDVDAISFTGSTRVGFQVAELAGARDVKVQVETGGKNPLVVMADADLDRALDAAVAASYTAAGQWCIATSRILVETPVFEEFRDRFVDRTRAVRVGDGLDPDTDMGPVSSRVQYDKVLSYLTDEALSGTVLIGGGPAEGPDLPAGYYIAPTVVERPALDSPIVQEEIFGPVVALLSVSSLEEAITLANGTPYGLCAAIFTADRDRGRRFAQAVDAGRVGINLPTSVGDLRVPGGGRKNSGRGEYEGAGDGIAFFTHLKPIFFAG